MTFKRLLINLLLLSQITACVFMPRTAEIQPYANECEMATKKLELTAESLADFNACGSGQQNAEACLLVVGVIIPVGSLIVSGSIVAAGNSLHWMEYQNSCDAIDSDV